MFNSLKKSCETFNSLKTFGIGFIIIIGTVYFLQGFRNYVFGDAFDWFFRSAFQSSPGTVQHYKSIARITWNIKMLYGLIMDNFPIFHRHGIPYLMLSSILSLVGYLGLGIPSWSSSPASTLGFFWIALMGMGIADVITDALVVKKAKIVGQHGGANLQTFCWIMLYIGSLTGRPVSGTIVGTDGHGVRSLMLNVYTVTSGIVFFMALFLKEPLSHIQGSFLRFLKQFVRLFKSIFLDKHVLCPMLWIFFAHAIVPDVSSAMTYWKVTLFHFIPIAG
jgi:hypothetical protein